MKEPYPSLPKYDNEYFESSFRVCIVGFGGGVRRTKGVTGILAIIPIYSSLEYAETVLMES
jgi:hypothetical protein